MQIGKTYKLLDIQQHTDCQGCDRCTVLTLMEKGFMIGENVKVHGRLGDNLMITIGTSKFGIKESHLDCCTFEEIK